MRKATQKLGRTVLHCCGWLAVVASTARTEDKVAIEPRQNPTAVFGETEAAFAFDVRCTAPLAGRLDWSLAANERTLFRGELPVEAGLGQPVRVSVPLKIPSFKEGLAFPLELRLSVFAKGASEPGAIHRQALWVFGRNPFVDRAEWLQKLAITLFDPKGHTAAVFDRAEIPYRETRHLAALAAVERGLVVVGERTPWDEHRGLGEALAALAARGVPVLCLAPSGGTLRLPAAAAPAADLLVLKRREAIHDLDKRLDAEVWSPGGSIVAAGLAVQSDGEQLVADVADASRGWPWLEWRYARTSAAVIVCGFGVIEQWEANPTPRYLLARMFDRLAQKPADSSTAHPQEK